MNLVTFLLLVLTSPYWFPIIAIFFIGIGLIWMIVYPTACTIHLLYVWARYGKLVHWQLLYPGQ